MNTGRISFSKSGTVYSLLAAFCHVNVPGELFLPSKMLRSARTKNHLKHPSNYRNKAAQSPNINIFNM